jgi:transposase
MVCRELMTEGICGIIVVIRSGLRWREAPAEYGTPKMIYNYFIRWSRMGVFNKIFPSLATKALLGDRGYDADWFRHVLIECGITPCIPSKINCKIPIPHDHPLYRQRHKVENMFGKIKDWRRIHNCYDRCPHTFMSAICIATTVIFWINQ